MRLTRMIYPTSAALVLLGTLAVACGEGNRPSQDGDSASADGTSGDSSGSAASSNTNDEGDGAPFEVLGTSRGKGLLTQVGVPAVSSSPASGLTVRVSKRETLPAETAVVVALLISRSAAGPFASLSTTEDAALRAALTDAGVANDDISIVSDPSFGPYVRVSVKTPISGVAALGPKVFEAVTNSVGTPEQKGVQYGLKDCGTSLDPLRKAVFVLANERAKAMAAAGGLTLGSVVAATEQAPFNPYGPQVSDPCASDGNLVGKGFAIPALDSRAEVEVSLDLTVTYSLGGAPAANVAGLTVTGSGSIRAKANEAYILVQVDTGSGPTGPRPIAERDRVSLIEKLAAIGIEEDDIEIVNQPFGGPSIVSVETTKLSELARIGDDVADIIEEVLGRSFNKGAVFTHSNCEGILELARKEATLDARDKGAKIAAATGTKVAGALVAASEAAVQLSPYGGIAATNPCDDDPQTLAGSGYGIGALKPFDAVAEVEVTAALTLTFAVSAP